MTTPNRIAKQRTPIAKGTKLAPGTRVLRRGGSCFQSLRGVTIGQDGPEYAEVRWADGGRSVYLKGDLYLDD